MRLRAAYVSGVNIFQQLVKSPWHSNDSAAPDELGVCSLSLRAVKIPGVSSQRTWRAVTGEDIAVCMGHFVCCSIRTYAAYTVYTVGCIPRILGPRSTTTRFNTSALEPPRKAGSMKLAGHKACEQGIRKWRPPLPTLTYDAIQV